jgi:hypothetical protein
MLTSSFAALGRVVAGRVVASFVRERRMMHWYNPKTWSAEDVPAPFTDEEALEMLRGNHNSAAFVKEYERLRDDGMGVEQALIFVGHRFRMWHLRFQRVG